MEEKKRLCRVLDVKQASCRVLDADPMKKTLENQQTLTETEGM
ncbi:MAG: hypothetical protein RR330_06960 [Alistipes sp.]